MNMTMQRGFMMRALEVLHNEMRNQCFNRETPPYP